MEKIKKYLDINENPFVRVLPQYAFIDAIVNNDKTNGHKICSIEVEQFDFSKWENCIEDGKIITNQNVIDVYRNGYGANQIGGIYRELEDNIEFTFNIIYMQYTNRWDGIIFFLNKTNNIQFSDDIKCDFRFTIHCCGDVRIDFNDNVVCYKKGMGKEIKWYKIKKESEIIKIYISLDGLYWVQFFEVYCGEIYDKEYIVGFHFHLYNNQYLKWLCNNFIQIRYSKNQSNKIGYSGFLNRDFKNYAINPLVCFSYEKRENILKYGFWEYIVNSIDSSRYIEIWLNEYYIGGLEAYKKYNFEHESMIMGYDNSDKSVRIMSFNKGKPQIIDVQVENLLLAWNSAFEMNHIVHLFEFLPDEGGYNLNIKSICKQIEDYLKGRNSTEDYTYIAQREEGSFGLDIYDAILEDEKGKIDFLEDLRIPYIIKEHKECMKHRINYLYELHYLDEHEYECISSDISKIARTAQLVLNMVIKYNIKNDVCLSETIWSSIEEMRLGERKCYKYLKQVLLDKCNESFGYNK